MTCWDQIDQIKKRHAELEGWLKAYGKSWRLIDTTTAEFRVRKSATRHYEAVTLSHCEPEALKDLIAAHDKEREEGRQ